MQWSQNWHYLHCQISVCFFTIDVCSLWTSNNLSPFKVESDPECQMILKLRQAEGFIDKAPVFGNVETVDEDAGALLDQCEGLVGGFPCQATFHKLKTDLSCFVKTVTLDNDYFVTSLLGNSMSNFKLGVRPWLREYAKQDEREDSSMIGVVWWDISLSSATRENRTSTAFSLTDNHESDCHPLQLRILRIFFCLLENVKHLLSAEMREIWDFIVDVSRWNILTTTQILQTTWNNIAPTARDSDSATSKWCGAWWRGKWRGFTS